MPDNQTLVNSLTDKLAALMEMAALVNSHHDLDAVVTRAVESACRLTGAETGSLLLLDGKSGELRFKVVLGQQSSALAQLRIPKGQGIAGWVAEHNSAIIVPDVQADKRFFRIADDTTNFVTISMIAVPLHIKGRVTGVLQAINRQQGAFDHADLKLAIALANLVAPALGEAEQSAFSITD